MKIKEILKHPLTHILLLTVLAMYAYGRVLNSYFLADDFGEIRYVSEIFNGDIARLISNFTGNFMQIPSMAVYRPWLLMTLVFDFAIWQTNAFGYYLTNFLHYLACSILIYFLIKKLTGYWGPLRSNLAALSSGLIFAVNPLHCESLSWVVGRVDIVCLAYYLAGLYLIAHYMDSRKTGFLLGSLAAFWFAIFTKEMAIGLPVVACVLAFIYNPGSKSEPQEIEQDRISKDLPEPPPQAPLPGGYRSQESSLLTATLTEKTVQAYLKPAGIKMGLVERLESTKPVFITFAACTLVYFTIRYLALGTFFGGYTGSIGATQFSNILVKWLDPDSFFRILFPFNYALFEDGGIYRNILGATYFLAGSCLVFRLLLGTWPRRLSLLLLAWLATSLIPIYQLYGLGYNLEGMRFLFFATAPLSILLPVLLFAPLKQNSEKVDKRFLVAAIASVSLMVAVFARTSYKNNSVWIEAGRQTRAVKEKLTELARSTASPKKIAVLGIPKDRCGAHMILNGQTLNCTISPPFSKENLGEKVVSFEPMLFGAADLVNLPHLKNALANKNIENFYLWNFEKRDFEKLAIDRRPGSEKRLDITIPSFANQDPVLMPRDNDSQYNTSKNSGDSSIVFEKTLAGLGLEITPLNIGPQDFDYIEIQLNDADVENLAGKPVELSWYGAASENSKESDKHIYKLPANLKASQKLRIPLSRFWQWFTFKKINSIYLNLPPMEKVSFGKAELAPLGSVEPQVEVNRSSTNYGTYILAKSQNKLSVSVKPLPGSKFIEMQVGKLDYFFENFSGDDESKAVDEVIKKNASDNVFQLTRENFSKKGMRQVRVRSISGGHETIGEFSYPLTLEITD